MEIIKVGRFNVQVELSHAETFSSLAKYDVIVCDPKNGKILRQHIGCMGEKARNSRKEWCIEWASRLDILYNANDMACHNLLCYSKNYLMDEPKDCYIKEWNEQNNKQKVLAAWIGEMENNYKVTPNKVV